MSKKIIIVFISILTLLSCDKSFNFSDPTSYDSSSLKIKKYCKSNMDCGSKEVCDIVKKRCIENLCIKNSINCKYGECKIHNDIGKKYLKPYCDCNKNYKEYFNEKLGKKELICKPTCSTYDICKEGEGNVFCVEKNNGIKCVCSKGYFQDENNNCVSPCRTNSCYENEVCIADSIVDYHCICKSGFIKNKEDKCENPCKDKSCNFHGNCIVDSNGKGSCLCDLKDGYYLDDKDPFRCFSPCENKECSNGVCKIIDKYRSFCKCNKGYQDNDNNFTCEPSCDRKNICKGERIGSCDDTNGKVDCNCDNNNNWFQNEKLNCLNPCKEKPCGLNEKCIAVNDKDKECSCISNYLLDPDYEICKSPCEGHENCSNGSKRLGECIAISLTEARCECVDGATLDKENKLLCYIEQCLGVDCGEWGECVIGDNEITENIIEDRYCKCNIGYQDYDNNLFCTPKCNSNDCKNHGVCNDNKNLKYCECDYGYQDNNNNMVCNPDCNNDYYQCNEYGTCSTKDNGLIECMCTMENYIETSNKFGCIWNGYGTWSKGFQIDENNSVNSRSIALDNEGNIYIVGSFGGVVDFDPSEKIDEYRSVNYENYSNDKYHDIFITKFNRNGSYEWTKTVGSKYDDTAYSVVIDKNNDLYITGTYSDPQENVHVWGIVTVDFDFTSGVDEHTSKGRGDIFIMKIGKNGDYKWSKTIGGKKGKEVGYSLVLDKENENFFITGHFSVDVDFDPSSSEDILSSEGNSTFITKFSKNGNYKWTKTINSAQGKSISIDSDNNLYITGYFSGKSDFNVGKYKDIQISNGSLDIFITKISQNGIYKWTKTIGGIGKDLGESIAIYNNSIYIIGYFEEEVDFNPSLEVDIHKSLYENRWEKEDIFLISLNSNGDYKWSKTFGGKGTDIGAFVTVDNLGNIYFSGSFYGIVDFDNSIKEDNHGLENKHDTFLTKLNPDGSYLWTKTGNYHVGYSIAFKNNNIYTSGVGITKFSQNKPICKDIYCGLHGSCDVDQENNIYCKCDIGYQSENLYCK